MPTIPGSQGLYAAFGNEGHRPHTGGGLVDGYGGINKSSGARGWLKADRGLVPAFAANTGTRDCLEGAE